MLNEKQKVYLKNELLQMHEQLSKTEESTEIKDSSQEDVGELSMYDNHPADMGTELYERQKDIALHIHAGNEIEKVDNALQALKEGSYGICDVCHQEIQYERLEAIPYTTLCVDHATEKEIPNDRPVENDLLTMANPNTFADKGNERVHDGLDSFSEIAQSGTSETPSDFTGDRDDYNSLYDKDILDGSVEEIEEFTTSDITGKSTGIINSDALKDYEEGLDE